MPLYDVIMLTKCGTEGTPKLRTLLTNAAKKLWDRGAVIADIKPWGQRELAYRIRKQNTNYYHAQYTSLHVYCSPTTLGELESSLRTNTHVLRFMTLKQKSIPDFGKKEIRDAVEATRPSLDDVDLEADPAESMRWEYRNLVMQRVFEGRTKQELIAEQLVRHRFQSAVQRQAPLPYARPNAGPLLSELRDAGEPPAAVPPPPPPPDQIGEK